MDIECLPAAPVTSSALVNGGILVGFAAAPQGSATSEIAVCVKPIGRQSEIGWVLPAQVANLSAQQEPRQAMTQAYYSTVLDQPLDEVWSLIRDFNNYPAYIDDNRRGRASRRWRASIRPCL
ncbi:hypothetical protein [Bradyrhizobium sp. 147]|uniref:hypothetical protein n=1 Tax=Bradyrhizobium sp. 147 TaxID=2782623 RepID=UPI001FF8CEB7|nr:hypothetical protein [Bradyrhizobium sp. 147]